MLNENPNDFNWKNKLEDVNNLPGEALGDKNATWEKLHSRLHEMPGRIGAVWYWVAAACLLMAIITPYIKVNKKQVMAVINNPAQTLPKKVITPKISALKEMVQVDIPSSSIEKRSAINQAKQTFTKKYLPNDRQKKAGTATTDFSGQKDIQPVQTISLPLVSDEPVVTRFAVVAPKKRLKVVHINELGDPVEEPHNMVHVADYHSFQIRLINQEIFTSSSPHLSNTGFNIFKTTNAPSN